jgi:two-component system, sensor histidine kinase and response regulator
MDSPDPHEIERQWSAGLHRGEIFPYYQPKVSAKGTGVLGAEVLARWISPSLGNLPASSFIPLATRLGLIDKVTEAIVGKTLEDAHSWSDLDSPPVSFNVSTEYLAAPGAGARLVDLFNDSVVPAASITIEIDADFIRNPAVELLGNIRLVKAAGMRICLDNFDPQLAELQFPYGLPVDEIKIGLGAIDALDANALSRSQLLGRIAALGRRDIELTATGLESAADRIRVAHLGFHCAQGYGIGRPMSMAQWQTFVARNALDRRGAADSAPPGNGATEKTSRGRILIVDDMATNRFLISSCLVAEGYTVVEADSGEAALKFVARGGIDAMIMDYLMPGMSGVQVLKQVRRAHSSTTLPILIVTSFYDTGTVLDALASGANDYVTKPFESQVLLARLDAHIERKRFADELLRAKDDAVSANVAKSEFLSAMSHELRTPLNGILGLAELLDLEIAEAGHTQYAESVKLIRRSGKLLLDLISELLDLGRIESGNMAMKLENVEVAGLIDNVTGLSRVLIDKSGNRLAVEIANDVVHVHCDRTRLQQVLLNLLGNAAKFTANGKIGLTVRRGTDLGREWIDFAVSDSGIGMTETECAVLFKPYSQANQDIWSRYGGTGLGLMICKNIVELLGGRLEVQSAMGVGSTFTVRLPVRHVPVAAPV